MTSNESSNIILDDFFRPISFELDESIDPVLSSPNERDEGDDEENQSIPRERIVAEVRRTTVVAAIERPLRLGTFNNHSAFLLTFHFSFQRVLEGFLDRIRAVDIKITFEDAPKAGPGVSAKNPSVVKFHPTFHQGPVSYGTVAYRSEAHSDLTIIPGGPSIGASHSQEVAIPQESSLKVHGTRPKPNRITWTIEENRLLAQGMPREVKLPLIINTKEGRRFSAKVVVAAHFLFMSQRLAKTFPVIGRHDVPLYFDPIVLRDLAETGAPTSSDGSPVSEWVGELSIIELGAPEYSSFPVSVGP